MNYLDVYFSRVNHFGETVAERIKNSGIVAFEKWMAQSPFTVTDLSVERGLYCSGIIQTRKDEEEKKIMYLYVANDIPIVVGDILTWRQDNGAVEKWLLLQKEHKVHEQYQTFQIIKCNYELKWIDANGYLQKSWAYALSSVDNMVKGNFRMWHSLISPQPNKFAEIIMPRPKLEGLDKDELLRGINFIIDDEAWTIIECDWTSVDGIVYMSLTESKVNYNYDDREVEVADLDRYKFPVLPTLYKVGDTIVPEFEAGTLNQWEIVLSKPKDCDFIDDNFVATGAGQCIVTMSLKGKPAVFKTVEITIDSQDKPSKIWIEGPDQIRLDRYATYSLYTEDNEGKPVIISDDIEIQLAETELAEIKQALDDENHLVQNKFIVHANWKNKLGDIVLTAEYDSETYSKTVKIIPLW